ncbi:MAG: alanine--tRNA ligase [Candidatus Limnocylindrales bacterium]
MPDNDERAHNEARMRPLTADEIRARFLRFFEERGHEVVPSASLVPAGDQTLLFTNSGMVQFKDVFRGVERRSYSRAVDSQRCLRVAGKHNDFEEVGRTPRHHTLFEMLGSWSFGDYFKREAIHWAWEFLTEDLGIPGERLAATTYTDDEESWAIWRDEIGLPPERMARWGDVDSGDDHNFWRMADTGPCGPNSEIHYDRGSEFSEGPGCVPDHTETCPRWLEIWNLVFMEFDQPVDGPRTELPFKSVDTGMGLERLASVLQDVPTNYDTDLFLPIMETMRGLLGHDQATFEANRFSYQVIADHSRAITFLLADGVLPSNEGRGYVLRRIVRRAVRHGRLLGRSEPFLAETAQVVIDLMAEAYPVLVERHDAIIGGIVREESAFARTLQAGTNHLEEALIPLTGAERVVGRELDDIPADAPVLAGTTAFKLHDTYGFPIDLTVELAAEYGVRVDREGFEDALQEQRERSRSGAKLDLARQAELTALYDGIKRRVGDTTFLGYETTSATGRVRAIVRDGTEYDELEARSDAEGHVEAAAEASIVLDETPFYAEGGGQIGDRGVFRDAQGEVLFTVTDTQRPVSGLIVHEGTLHGRVSRRQELQAEVDPARRARTMRNHTGTHLLHRALRNTLGDSARQAGSLVTPDYLRFDYPFDRGLSPDEKAAIEAEVRKIIREDRPVRPEHMTMAQAQAAGADAFFDEKYGETVRTVRVEDYSHELCGGTHCRATGQIGGFIITGERSIGSGMRRIEAVTGEAAEALTEERFALLEAAVAAAGAQTHDQLVTRIEALKEERKARPATGLVPTAQAAARTAEVLQKGALVSMMGGFRSMDELRAWAKEVRSTLKSGVIAAGLDDPEKPQIFVTVSDDLVEQGIDAGELVRDAVSEAGGKGGGKAGMAQGKVPEPSGLQTALERLRERLGD